MSLDANTLLRNVLNKDTEAERQKQLMLLSEIDLLLRLFPPRENFAEMKDDSMEWLGKATAVLRAWDPLQALSLTPITRGLQSHHGYSFTSYGELKALLHQAKHDLQMRTGAGVNAAYDAGAMFSYFDDIRKLLEQATNDAFFVDPWLDVDFVSRYLPSVRSGVTTRLLTSKRLLATLLPAIDLFVKQHGTSVSVRVDDALHDRYLLIDGSACYQSGASFKDGARKAPTTLTQIVDAFPAVRDTYEKAWIGATVHR